jgi:putative heme-binding domain-containing protein
MLLEFTTGKDRMKLIAARPQHDTYGIGNAMLVAPGSAEQSVLVHRLSRRGPGQMPPLGSQVVDERAVALFRQWIGQLKPARPLVQKWQMEELLPEVESHLAGRSTAAGRALYEELGCAQCHRLRGQGGSVGPDLTGAGGRLGPRGLLEAILEPSKTIPPEYVATILETEDGRMLVGRIEREDEQSILLRTGANLTETVTLAKAEIAQRRPSDVSNMPSGTLDVLHKPEVLDLIAFLLSARANADPAEK